MKFTFENLIIRHNKAKELVLYMNKEKVFFLEKHGQAIVNGLNYDILSDKYNQLEKGE